MICPNCQKSELDESDVFCSTCGVDIQSYIKVQKYNTKKIDVVAQIQDSANNTFVLSSETIKDFQNLSQEMNDLQDVPNKLSTTREQVQLMQSRMTQDSRLLSSLKIQFEKEKHDIEQLKKLSISSILSSIKGDKEQKLQEEEEKSFLLLNKIEGLEKQVDEQSVEIDRLTLYISDLKGLNYRLKENKEALTKLINESTKGIKDPVEDQLEEELQNLQQKFNPLQNQLDFKQRVLNLLNSAYSDLHLAYEQLQSAYNEDNLGMAMGGIISLSATSKKHVKTKTASDSVASAHHKIDLARNLDQNLPGIEAFVKDFSVYFNAIFENFISQLTVLKNIKDSIQSVQNALIKLNKTIQDFKLATKPLENDCSSLKNQIENVRNKLLQERKRMIEDAIKSQ